MLDILESFPGRSDEGLSLLQPVQHQRPVCPAVHGDREGHGGPGRGLSESAGHQGPDRPGLPALLPPQRLRPRRRAVWPSRPPGAPPHALGGQLGGGVLLQIVQRAVVVGRPRGDLRLQEVGAAAFRQLHPAGDLWPCAGAERVPV